MEEIKLSGHLYGITHHRDGSPRIIETKSVKVGIGLHAGRAIHVFIDDSGKWTVVVGIGKNAKKKQFSDIVQAKDYYFSNKSSAPEVKYPSRLSYFTFTQTSPDGDTDPDFEAIEAYGSKPKKIDISFVRPDPFVKAFQYWAREGIRCQGDGRVAWRRVSFAPTETDYSRAEAAKADNREVFQVDKCFLDGCPYGRSTPGRTPECKPFGRLFFQLSKLPRFGSSAIFTTTGFRSIKQIFSSLEQLKQETGLDTVRGLSAILVVRPYKTSHDGQPTTQFGVTVEYQEGATLEQLKKSIQEGAKKLDLVEQNRADEIPLESNDQEAESVLREFGSEAAGEQGD